MSDKQSFLNMAIQKLSELTSLEVNTLVGDYAFDKDVEGRNTIIMNDSTEDRMCSQINLLTGDITTAMTKKFVVEYKELREYHLMRESQGHDIVKKNLEVLTKIVETLVDFTRKKTPEDANS